MISFKLPIKVIPKQRPRVTKRGTYMPSKYLAQREYIQAKIRGFKHLGNECIKMDVLFVYKRSKTSAKNKYSMPVSDIDNLTGSILDACEGILFENDRQIVEIKAKKMYGDFDAVVVNFKEME